MTSVSPEELLRNATAPQREASVMPPALLVFAHPDDETVALGARMGRFGRAHLVHVTDGAPRNEQDSRWHGFANWQEYRAARAAELAHMLDVAGLPELSRECLEIPDQEAALRLAELARRVTRLLEERRPQVVFTHPYEGGHPDHDACAFAVHHAVASRRAQGGAVPAIIEGAFYHAGPLGMGTMEFLPADSAVAAYELTAEERQRKQALIECFISQRETLQGIGLQWERFRLAPAYGFSRPPHTPPVLYDRYPWGMTSGRFVELALEAERELEPELRGAG